MGTNTAPGLNNFVSHHNPLQAPVPFFAPHSQIFNTAAAAVSTTNVTSFPNQAPHLQGAEGKLNDRLLRSGKWVHEEEVYAALLIEAFESGVATVALVPGHQAAMRPDAHFEKVCGQGNW